MDSTRLPDLPPEQIGEAIRAFMAKDCPGCGDNKFILEDPFCDVCLGVLTPELRDKMFDNTQFIATFHPAMAHLKLNRGNSAGDVSSSSSSTAAM